MEHDQLIHEFERLTTDPDGLLGVLEDTLHENGDEAAFEAKKLLCALFQVQTKLLIVQCRTLIVNTENLYGRNPMICARKRSSIT